jgi:hypothetical protein
MGNMRHAVLVLGWCLALALSSCVGGPKANCEIHFAPESRFASIEPQYVPTNYGFFWTNWNADGEIYWSRVLISTTNVTQQERAHLIREELTQSLGLMNDSYAYADSVFYQEWTDVTQYSPADRRVIDMLYSDLVSPGMTQAQASEALSQRYTAEAIRYFAELAFGAEYGDGASRLHRWAEDLIITVRGDPSDEDRAALDKVVQDLNEIIESIQLYIAD